MRYGESEGDRLLLVWLLRPLKHVIIKTFAWVLLETISARVLVPQIPSQLASLDGCMAEQ